jgi:hypothetical protein
MSQSESEVGRSLNDAAGRYADSDEREPRAIERRIDATRADMRATLEALERRLSMDRLIELTIGRVRERGGEFAGNLTDAATQNPVPMLLTSIGLGWMMLTSRRGPRPSYSTAGTRSTMAGVGDKMSGIGDKMSGVAGSMSDTLHGMSDSMHGAVDSTRERLHGAAESTRERLEQSAESLRHGASRAAAATREQVEYAREQVDYARERMTRLLDEQPLMIGAIGLAAGAILGALLPTTEHEDRWLGEARDKAVRDVAQKSRSKFEAAREHAAAYSAPAGGREDEAAREQAAQRPH